MRDIKVGEELCWDYAMTEDTFWSMKCQCGSPDCRKLIAGYRFLPPARRWAYKGFISEWLLDPHRPFVGHAVDAFERFRYPIPPLGPFRMIGEREALAG